MIRKNSCRHGTWLFHILVSLNWKEEKHSKQFNIESWKWNLCLRSKLQNMLFYLFYLAFHLFATSKYILMSFVRWPQAPETSALGFLLLTELAIGFSKSLFSSPHQLYIIFFKVDCTVFITHETPSLPHVQVSCFLPVIGFWNITLFWNIGFSFILYFTVQYVDLHESPSPPHVQVSCSLLVIGFWTPLSTTQFRFILYFTV